MCALSLNEACIDHVLLQVNGGQFDMNLTNKKGYVYIKNNGLKHPTIFSRAFGAYNAGKIRVSGRSLTRTWSLLSEKAAYGMSSIRLSHKPEDMVRADVLIIFRSTVNTHSTSGLESGRSNCYSADCVRLGWKC
jgi:hypothetical protein